LKRPLFTNRLEAVGFDLWETLLTNPQGASKKQDARRIEAMLAILSSSHPCDAVTVESAYRELWHRCHELYWSRDLDIPTRRQIEHFLEAMSLSPDQLDDSVLAELESAYVETILHHPPAVEPHAHAVQQQLREAGFRIGLISNTGRTPGRMLRRVLEHHGLHESIDVMIFSDEQGVCKPQLSIFHDMLRGLNVAPEACAFVGDNLDVDVYGARQCGMVAIHFVPQEKGTAVAPPLMRDETFDPDATVQSLAEIPALLGALVAP
jgi:putative hydrolase of the HAD superfamily